MVKTVRCTVMPAVYYLMMTNSSGTWTTRTLARTLAGRRGCATGSWSAVQALEAWLSTAAALFSLFFLFLILFVRAENYLLNNVLDDVDATDLWSSATDLWFRAYRFMLFCYKNMALSTDAARGRTATDLWSKSGGRPGDLFCYEFMVSERVALAATNLWSRPSATDLWSWGNQPGPADGDCRREETVICYRYPLCSRKPRGPTAGHRD